MSENTSITVTRTIDAPSKEVFDVISLPDHHVAIDGSGFVLSVDQGDRITGTGQVFTMNMTGDHMGGDYKTDNHVTGYDEGKLLAWQTAPAGTQPPGWQWVWELTPLGPDSTEVRHTYDWSNVTDPDLLSKITFPLVSEDDMETALKNLAAAVAS
ncbi:SRPBCC family protein [Ornithinimicrobium sp. Arc0846-15]|nr:SRPBCC family protein [Ornithinimicrobium laminariae]